MKGSMSCVCATLCLASAAAAAGTETPTPSFTSIELRSLAGAPGNVVATGINRYGDVVGSSDDKPFVYYHRNGTVVQLEGVTGDLSAAGINDHEQIAGEQVDADGIFPLEWTPNGGVVVLPTSTLGMATAIGNNGDIAGNIDNGHADNLAVRWVGPTHQEEFIGVLWEYPYPPGYGTSASSAINNLGHVTGVSDAGEGTDPNTAVSFGVHAFLYTGPGENRDLGALALSGDGSDDSEGYGINDVDEVVGASTTAIPARNSSNQPCPNCGVASHAFLWRAGKMTDLGNLASIPGWDSRAESINNSGEIVGWSDSIVNGTSTHRAFLYVGGRMLNLQFYVHARDPNVRLTEAVGINCEGWIVANGFNVGSPDVSRAYLLIPRGHQPRAECAAH
jgi:probable HAF family extracellular repeat protein